MKFNENEYQLHQSLQCFVFLQLHVFWRQRDSQKWFCFFVCLWSHLVHLVTTSSLVHFTAQVMQLSVSCFSPSGLPSGDNNFKASKAGKLNRSGEEVLTKIILPWCLAEKFSHQDIKLSLCHQETKSYPHVQDGFSHRGHAQKQESGSLFPLSNLCVHYNILFFVDVVVVINE